MTTNSEEPVFGPIVYIVLITSLLIVVAIPTFWVFWSVDSTVVDKTPVEKYDGDYTKLDDDRENGVIIRTIKEDTITVTAFFGFQVDWEGAYLYKGTVYEIEQSEPYFNPSQIIDIIL